MLDTEERLDVYKKGEMYRHGLFHVGLTTDHYSVCTDVRRRGGIVKYTFRDPDPHRTRDPPTLFPFVTTTPEMYFRPVVNK